MYPMLESDQAQRELVDAAVALIQGQVSPDEAAALVGMHVDYFVAALEAPAIQAQIETAAAKAKLSGKLTEARALGMLDRLLVNIEGQLDTLSPAAATRVAEILLRISGLAEKRAAEARQVTPQPGNGFSINIVLSGTRRPVSTGCATIAGEVLEVDE